jgi:tetratricopeptide (TPR) repeat protein
LRILSGSLQALTGDTVNAEATYRAIVHDFPQSEVPVQLLYGLLRAANREADAAAVLDQALVEIPKSVNLRWIKAGVLERDTDFEGAIAVYEELYSEDSSNTVVANNLASLIATHRTDAASLERAYTIARRLRGTQVPAFQDTFGWIEYRRGNLEEARRNLSDAAAGLPNDPLTQFHLAMVLADLGQNEAAEKQFERVLDLAGDTQLPQFALALKRLEEIRAQRRKTTP